MIAASQVADRNQGAGASYRHAGEEESLDQRWDRLYRDCRDELYRGACMLVGARDAEEVVQEAFERAMREQQFFERVDNPVGWLRVVAARQALSRLRRAQRWSAIQAFVRPAPPPEADLDLAHALTTLPATQRAAIVLRYYHGLDYAEIAAAVGIAPSSVGPLLTRARSALRELVR
ncbi:MAG: RNA polymerase sigma factor [Candidatus Dormibacteraeota bacterium]|nr:RNA polymerase sigma factor [Candidatus Dormibacteraeota bacterium]MDQ6871972.1 RNA polymerase sigma factor [Gemmatimonadota bacterium]